MKNLPSKEIIYSMGSIVVNVFDLYCNFIDIRGNLHRFYL